MSDWINPLISQSKSPSPETSETQLCAIKTTVLSTVSSTNQKFFQLIKAENIDLNVYSHFQKQNNKEQLWYNLKNFKNVNSVSVNNKQTNKKPCKFDYRNLYCSLFSAFKEKQPRKNSLLHLDEISKLVDEKNATEFKDFIFFPGK